MSALDLFRRPELGVLALEGYRRERWTEACFTAGPALMEGGFIGVIADKLFHVHPAVLALVTAAPMFGNLSSAFWARLAHGRQRVPFATALMGGFTACVALVALVPEGAAGAWLLVGALILARLLLGGIVTLRSVVWTLNYPSAARGRVTARLSIVSTLGIAATAWAGGALLDGNPERFRLVYALGAVIAALGVLAFSRVPIVGELDHLAQERAFGGEGNARGGVISVLREDGDYARFLGWQMLLGTAAMMTEAPLLYLVSRQMGASYAESIGIMIVIPFALSVVAIPFWAAYLDRVHVSSFRSVHSWVFAFAQALLWLGAVKQSLMLLALARVVNGAARSGGGLAWNIGHNHFAPSARAGLYMGVHVTLTGIRGAIAPFLGMALYLGWSARPLPFTGLALPEWAGLGDTLLLLSAALSSVAAFGFRSLKRRIERRP
ncbi:MAG: MFS transporter [Myxococcota bacterium]